MQVAPQFQNRFVVQAQLSGQSVGWLSFQHPSQEQNYLWGGEMSLLEHRPAVQVVGLPTPIAAVHRQMAFLCCAKDMGFFYTGLTSWTLQPFRVEVLLYPFFAFFLTQEVCDWKFHVSQFTIYFTLSTVEPKSNFANIRCLIKNLTEKQNKDTTGRA